MDRGSISIRVESLACIRTSNVANSVWYINSHGVISMPLLENNVINYKFTHFFQEAQFHGIRVVSKSVYQAAVSTLNPGLGKTSAPGRFFRGKKL